MDVRHRRYLFRDDEIVGRISLAAKDGSMREMTIDDADGPALAAFETDRGQVKVNDGSQVLWFLTVSDAGAGEERR